MSFRMLKYYIKFGITVFAFNAVFFVVNLHNRLDNRKTEPVALAFGVLIEALPYFFAVKLLRCLIAYGKINAVLAFF